MNSFDIDVYSHHLTVTGFSLRGKDALLAFCKTLGQVGKVQVNKQLLWKIVKVFVGVHADRSSFQFHVNQLPILKEHLQRYGFFDQHFNIRFHKAPEPVKYDMPIKSSWVLRDDQVPIAKYLEEPGATKTITIQPGKGKTLLSLVGASLIGERTALTMKSGFFEQWISVIKDVFGYGPNEIMVIKGGKHLKTAIALGKEGLITQRFIFISNGTLYDFIKHYEATNGDTSLYGCSPQELYGLLGVGLVIRDEVHLEFHLNFRLDLYTHVKKTINMSATLRSDDPFINKMYLIMFPPDSRYKGSVYDKYIAVTAYTYRINDLKKIRCQNFAFKSYSHVLFEESIMRNTKLLGDYLNLIWTLVEGQYLPVRKPGQKMIIFCATVELCTLLVGYLQQRVGSLTVKRKTMDDPFQNALTADIVVTTIKSAGTGFDIPGLLKCLMTDSINSRQANEQVMGRLRKLKGEWAGTTPEFMYLVCLSIQKHVEYHHNKMDVFRDKVVSHNERSMCLTIG